MRFLSYVRLLNLLSRLFLNSVARQNVQMTPSRDYDSSWIDEERYEEMKSALANKPVQMGKRETKKAAPVFPCLCPLCVQ